MDYLAKVFGVTGEKRDKSAGQVGSFTVAARNLDAAQKLVREEATRRGYQLLGISPSTAGSLIVSVLMPEEVTVGKASAATPARPAPRPGPARGIARRR